MTTDDQPVMNLRGRRGGGVRLPETSRRSVWIMVRMTPGEKAALAEKAGPRGSGELLRALAFGRRARLRSTIPEINRAAFEDFARVAANLNQIAKHLNHGHVIDGHVIAPVVIAVGESVNKFRPQLIGVSEQDQQGDNDNADD